MVFYERARSRMHAAISAPVHIRTCRATDRHLGFRDPFLKIDDDLEGLLTENRIFKQRNVDIGVVNSPTPGSGASPA